MDIREVLRYMKSIDRINTVRPNVDQLIPKISISELIRTVVERPEYLGYICDLIEVFPEIRDMVERLIEEASEEQINELIDQDWLA